MSEVNRKSSCRIGRRTRVNVLEGKTIRKLGDGGDVFEDYWTDSDEDNSVHSSKSSRFFDFSVKSQDEELSDFASSDLTEAVSELGNRTRKSIAKLSKSSTKLSLPVSSSKSLHKNRMSSISFKHSPKSVVRNLDKEMIQDTLQHISSVSNRDELELSSVSTPNKNSETARSLEKTQVKTKSSLEMEKILSNYDKYDAIIMKMMQENDDNCPQRPEQNDSTSSECSVLKLNENNLSNNLSLTGNIDDEHDNFDKTAIISTKSKESKSSGINSLKRKKFLRKFGSTSSKLSSLPSHISPNKPVITEEAELNTSLKSRKKSNKMKYKENSQRMLNISNSGKETSDYVAVKSPFKSISVNSFQMAKPSRKTATENKREALRDLSSRVNAECDLNIQENRNESNSSLKSPEKRKYDSEKHSPSPNKKNTTKSSIENKRQKLAVDETNQIPENELNSSDDELRMNDNASVEELLSDISGSLIANKSNIDNNENVSDKYTSKEQNSYNLSPEKGHLRINSNINALSPQSYNIRSKEKHLTELKDAEKKIVHGKQISNSQLNSSNPHEQQASLEDLSVEKEQLSSVSDNYSLPRSKRKQPLESSIIKIQSPSRKNKQNLKGTEKTIDGKQRSNSQLNSSNPHGKQTSVENLSVEKEQLSSVSDNYSSPRSKRKQPLESSIIKIQSSGRKNKQNLKDTKKKIIDGKQRSNSQLNSSNPHEQQASVEDLSVEKEQLSSVSDNYSSPRSKRKQPLESSIIKIQSPGRKNKQNLKDSEKKIIDGKKRSNSQLNSSNPHGKQTSVEDLSVEREQLSSVSDNYSSPRSKRKQPLESSKIKIQSPSRKNKQNIRDTEKKIIDGKQRSNSQLNSSHRHGKQTSVEDLSVEKEQLSSVSDNFSSPRSKVKKKSSSRENKQKSISEMLSNHESQQPSIDDQFSAQELHLNNSFDNPQSPKNVSKKKHSSPKSVKRRKKSYNKEQVRRSSRERYPPLARWRNERLLYRFENGGIKILGIDEGIKDNDISIQQIYRRYDRQKKIEKIPKIKKTKLFDPKLQKKVTTNVYKAFQSIAWVDPVSANNSYRFKRIFETTNSSFGYIEIDGFERKPPQHMPDEDLQLTLIKGEVEVIIQENSFKPQKRDMFIIPRGISYSIINIKKGKALLAFSVGKFKLLEKGLVN